MAKVAAQLVRDEMTDLLAPRQLGFGVKGGAEAAVHAARVYLRNLQPSSASEVGFLQCFQHHSA